MEKIFDAVDIGSLIKKKRKELGMTQAQLADMSGNGVRFISELENGKSTMEVGKVLDTLHVLGFDLFASARGDSL
ncbi:MAG: helix-turn-helix transcriptional regulator [Oscillospiraceae bacterium]|nr:helix-turn-helix transcriptional regulator [Oscillospiraceae bacterium]